MSVEFTVEVSNLEDFTRKMQRLDKATQEFVQDALNQTAQEIMFRARQLAPVRTGWLMQNIYAQIMYLWAIRIGCYVPYAIFQELGTSRIRPRYFLTRALQESTPKLVLTLSLALQRAAAEASME